MSGDTGLGLAVAFMMVVAMGVSFVVTYTVLYLQDMFLTWKRNVEAEHTDHLNGQDV